MRRSGSLRMLVVGALPQLLSPCWPLLTQPRPSALITAGTSAPGSHEVVRLSQPARVEEVIDNDTPIYSVRCGSREYAIYGPDLDEEGGGSWGRARRAFL